MTQTAAEAVTMTQTAAAAVTMSAAAAVTMPRMTQTAAAAITMTQTAAAAVTMPAAAAVTMPQMTQTASAAVTMPAAAVAETLPAAAVDTAKADKKAEKTAAMGFKSILVAVLCSVMPKPLDPQLDFVEVFAGEHAVSKGMYLLGYHGMPLDLRLDPRHDIMSAIGLVMLIVAIARLRPGGIFWAAPPCSTWVFFSRHSTGRNVCIHGYATDYNEAQNALVCRLLLVCRLCIARGVFFIIEQPESTCMWEFPPFARFLKKHPEVKSIRLQMGAYGLLATKGTILMGTAPYLDALARKMTQSEVNHVQACSMQTTVTYVDASGKKRCHGGKDLTKNASVSFRVRRCACFGVPSSHGRGRGFGHLGCGRAECACLARGLARVCRRWYALALARGCGR
jgi:hypothetical protein